ncbi:MAG: hypothetical protein ACK5F7_06605, partial [Planctomycetaceae bacterium]
GVGGFPGRGIDQRFRGKRTGATLSFARHLPQVWGGVTAFLADGLSGFPQGGLQPGPQIPADRHTFSP